jgi:hypothetical protein
MYPPSLDVYTWLIFAPAIICLVFAGLTQIEGSSGPTIAGPLSIMMFFILGAHPNKTTAHTLKMSDFI